MTHIMTQIVDCLKIIKSSAELRVVLADVRKLLEIQASLYG